MNSRKKKTGLIVFIAAILIATLAAVLDIFAMNATKSHKIPFFKPQKQNGHGYVAALYLEGVIEEANMSYNQEWLLATIKDLKNDDANKGIALFIDSPGGAVYEADETYLALQDYRTTGRPIYVYQGSLAASGGYYISCAGNKIYANRNTLTGSIGIIMGTSLDFTDLMKTLGIKSETITSGKNKNMFNYNEPVSSEQRNIMRSIADEAYEQFTGIVAMNRNIPLFELKEIADGRIYTAKQALKLNLIDTIASWDEMLQDMADNCFDGKKYKIEEFRYNYKLSLRDYILQNVFGSYKALSKKADRLLSAASLRYPAFLYSSSAI